MRLRGITAALVFGAAWSTNPAFVAGCGHARFDFDEAKAVSLIDVANKASPYHLKTTRGEVIVTLSLAQSTGNDELSALDVSPFAAAHACGQRTFLKSANACLDSTTVPVEGVMSVVIAEQDSSTWSVPVRGELVISGTSYRGAKALGIEATNPSVMSVSADFGIDQQDAIYLASVSVGTRRFPSMPAP